METLRQFLQRGRNGNAVLFCGAGFTADCLNFEDDSRLGVTFHLLKLLNEELKANGKQSGFKDIRNAAKRFKTELGTNRLMRLLKERFRLSNISASIVEIAEYPWSSIYTTNYDNGLELALRSARKKFEPLNNLDDPSKASSGTPIIHLHGFAEAWTDLNFEQSCVLDADSYRNLPGVSNWLDRLRFDIDRAETVVFIGFSAADFHLSQIFFNASGLKPKAFFINPPAADPDPDQRATQEDFGEPIYIGREAFSQLVAEVIQQDVPIEPRLASFVRYLVPQRSASVPPVQDIEDLLVWGKIVHAHVKRDIDISKSDYHVLRDEVAKVTSHLGSAGRIAFLHGDICDGKSLVALGAMNGLAAGRPIFELRHSYEDIISETASILASYPNSIFVIENCFSLREDRLLGLARQISASAGGLLLSARNISTEAETSKLAGLRSIPSLLEIGIERLRPSEVNEFIALIDQLAGWRTFRGLSAGDRRRFVDVECRGIIPSVLLHLLNSEYIRNKYREEYNKTSYLNAKDRQMIVAALLIANIGFDAPISLISNIFEKDFAAVLTRLARETGGLKLMRAEGGLARTIPSIGARNLLKNVVDSRDVVNTNILILEKISEWPKRDDFSQHIYSQLMRFSIISTVIQDPAEANRFFDHVSKIAFFRSMPLFWLQWHMAVCAQRHWVKGEEYLEMGYTAADAYEKRSGLSYNRKQLDDRKAKFLVARAGSTSRSEMDLFRDLKQALDVVGRLMRERDLTHHPYETLLDIVRLKHAQGRTLSSGLQAIILRQLKDVVAQAKSKLNTVPPGYQRSHAIQWFNQIEDIMKD